MIKPKDLKPYFMAQVIVGILASILIFLSDFGGYYYRDGYNHLDVWGYIYFGSGVLPSILMLLAIFGLLFPLKEAKVFLKAKKVNENKVYKYLTKSKHFALFTVALSVMGAVILGLTSWGIDWWLDTSFYAAFFGGLLLVFINKLFFEFMENN
ncbi:MAG: hypothetical protein GOU98_00045 [Candidatus Altiarchaeota archaeon]|nr:hypothetical protein [Candidatus Altiarchaeota archaeon]